jgi:hypothetical protein
MQPVYEPGGPGGKDRLHDQGHRLHDQRRYVCTGCMISEG